MNQIKSLCSINDLKKLEVINLCDGSRLGNLCDVEIDLCMGSLTAIFVPRRCTFWEYFQRDIKKRIRISWEDIERIGDDTILVYWREGHNYSAG